MQARSKKRQHADSPFTIVAARILLGNRRFPIKFLNELERQTAFRDILGILALIKWVTHHFVPE
jgi:hypothetical protein